MASIIPRDNTLVKLSDAEIIKFITTSGTLAKTKGLHELFFRRKNSTEIQDFLNAAIVAENNRREIFYGFIKVAWIPVIDILEAGDESEIAELKKSLLLNWSDSERKNFYEYVKKDFDVSDLLKN